MGVSHTSLSIMLRKMMWYDFEQSQRNTVFFPLKEKCLFYFSSIKEAQALDHAELSSL